MKADSLLSQLLGIPDAVAATTVATTPAQSGSLASLLPMLLIFFGAAYFLMIRPQQKRVKAQRKLMSELTKGDEIVTIGGIVGKITKITEEFLTIAITNNVEMTVQKGAVSNVLPKGTLKTIESN